MYKAIGFEKRNENYPQLTDHYFTGDYPVKPIDELGDNKTPLQEYATSAPSNLLLTPHLGGFTVESRFKAEIFMANKFIEFKLK